MGLPIGIIPGFFAGAVTGAFFGAMSAALNGQNVSSAGLMGGLIGGITGAISGGYKAYKEGINVWTGSGTSLKVFEIPTEVTNSDQWKTTQEMRDYYNENIGSVDHLSLEQVQDKINTQVGLASNTNLPKGYTLNEAGQISYGSNQAAGGITYGYYKAGTFTEAGSYILMSPWLKGQSLEAINGIFKHEFMHAWHWKILPNAGNFSQYSERATSTFSIAYNKVYKLNDLLKASYEELKTTGGIVYPRFMSWRNFNKIIPTWIK